jgi:hypothetical protein
MKLFNEEDPIASVKVILKHFLNPLNVNRKNVVISNNAIGKK